MSWFMFSNSFVVCSAVCICFEESLKHLLDLLSPSSTLGPFSALCLLIVLTTPCLGASVWPVPAADNEGPVDECGLRGRRTQTLH